MNTLSSTDLDAILTFSQSLARKAGALILEGSQAIRAASAKDVNEKKNSVDLVTEYDVRVEELVKGEITNTYPKFHFIGEESYAAGLRSPLTDEPTFCVDPIDGTTNFVHGFPFVCVSIGLIYKKVPVLGVIYNPFLDQLYTGLKGGGSYLIHNGGQPQKLPLSAPKPLPSLSQALIGVEWGSERSLAVAGPKSESFLRLAGDPAHGVVGGRMAHSLRSIGSAALNYALVAQGGLDMYWEIGCWPWDVAAGIVIAQEAGGVVTGSHDVLETTVSTDEFGTITENVLTGRKYFVVRAIADTETETGKDAQKRIMKEFYASVSNVEP